MRELIAIFSCLAFVGCALQPSAPAGSAACFTKAHVKYDGASAKSIEERLRQESARVSWDAVPEPYRAWAAKRLDVKLSAASVTLAASGNCKEVEAAAFKISGLGKRIAEVAKQCTDPQCLGEHDKATEIDATLDSAVCPLFPFC